MEKYRKKPVVIEATQWDGTAEDATRIIDWVLANGGTAAYRCDGLDECPGTEGEHYLVVQTLEGDMIAGPQWWIIRGVENEFYPCRNSVFQGTYEEVHDA